MPAIETMSVRELLSELTRIADAMRAFPDTPGSPDAASPTLLELACREDRVVAALRRRRHADLRSPRPVPRPF